MKISIIVPVYNVSKYLDKCLLSILHQTFKDFELILVDDGSTDGSGEMCDVYSKMDARVKVYHQKNQGQAVARNFAMKVAKGEYFGFVDSDDWVELGMFEKLYITAIKQNADVVICRLQNVTENGEVKDILGYDETMTMDKSQATSEILRDDKMQSFPVNKLYKRKIFDNVEFPSDRYFEDTATIYKVIYNSEKVVTIPYVGYNYRYNPNSTCNNKNLDYMKLVKREYDNALAFGERYMFCKKYIQIEDVRKLCANKAYSRMRSFIHLQVHKKFALSDIQKKQIDVIMKSFVMTDLSEFSFGQKLDAIGYRCCKPLLYLYLKMLAKVHPMSRGL
jgi:glycosyltransferase involved in cell wall biosynthesis